jgi:hypothetical protein
MATRKIREKHETKQMKSRLNRRPEQSESAPRRKQRQYLQLAVQQITERRSLQRPIETLCRGWLERVALGIAQLGRC